MTRDAIRYLASSKTLLMWLAIFFFAFAAIMFATSMAILFGVQVPWMNDFFQLLGIGGGASSARNVVSDGIMPRVPQAFAARSDPSVALGSPAPMVKLQPPTVPAASTAVEIDQALQSNQPAFNYGAPPTMPN